MAINTPRVLLGGLAAGVVLNVIDGVTYGVVLKDRMMAQADAFKPGMGASMRTPAEARLRAISSTRLTILATLTPLLGCTS